MPESRKRHKSSGTQQPKTKPATKGPSPRWLVPVMLVCFLVGIAWLVVYYISPTNALMDPLGGWNLAVGFAFIIAGMILATQWR